MVSIFRKHEDGYEALPAVVVADKTDKLGKRLAQLAFGLLILFFVTNGYIQSAKNGERLEKADKQRERLSTSLDRVTATLDQQSKLILQLQDAIREQNKTLRDAGLATQTVPGDMVLPGTSSSPNPRNTSQNSRTPNPQPRQTTRPQSSPKPSPKPTPKPSPSPTPRPQDPVTDVVCNLTGICL